jgi:hypothetical protein
VVSFQLPVKMQRAHSIAHLYRKAGDWERMTGGLSEKLKVESDE